MNTNSIAGAAPVRGRDLMRVLFAHTAGVVNLRAIDAGRGFPAVQAFLAPDDHAGIARFCETHADRELYFGVATRRDSTSARLDNCASLGALFVDLDFKTFPGGEAEARAAIARCPLAPTAVVQSGGGLHLYFALVEPYTLPDAAPEAKALLRRLAIYLGGDLAAAEPVRVLRLPGTRNHKYTPDRPVAIESLDASRVYQASDFDEWLPCDTREAQPTVAAPVNGDIVEHYRNSTLTSLAGTMQRRGMTREAILAALRAENTARCRPPLDDAEVVEIAHSIKRYPPADPPVAAAAPESPTVAARRRLTVTRASEIRIRPVSWLWGGTDGGRLALGTLALLGGREGIGKSTVAYTLAADLTRGRLPGAFAGRPTSVIIAATEDSWEHTIVPRLMAADADLDRVLRVNVVQAEGIEGSLSLPNDLPGLHRLIEENDARLVLLDPLLSRLDATLDTHKDAEVRRALEPLVRLAGEANACVLGLIHVNKGATGDPLTMLMGSRAFAAVARSVLFVMTDPDDDNRRLLGAPKNNLGRADLPTLAFRIGGVKVADTAEGEVWTGKVEWLGEAARSIREAMVAAATQAGDRTATQEAADWLHDYLTSQGGTADSATIKAAGAAAGHTRDALLRARDRVHVLTESRGFPRRTYWTLQSSHQSSQSSWGDSTTTTTATTDANRGVQSSQSSQSSQSTDTPRGGATTGVREVAVLGVAR